MKITFFQPPPAQRVGGLDAALQSLRVALEQLGLQVSGELPPVGMSPAVVHFHGLWQPSFPGLARECRARGLDYAVSPHGMLEPWAWRHKWWKKWPYFFAIERRWLRGAAALLATSAMEARRLQKFFPGKPIQSLPLGLTGAARPRWQAARQELGWSGEEIVLLYLSRLHPKKGPDLLLEALAAMHWPAVTRLVFVGDGEPQFLESLRRFASDHATRLPRIDWVGAVWGEARWKYLQGADLFCLPTHSENFGLAVLEACQVGTPALTTFQTPWAEIFGAERGYLAQPNPKSVQDALSRFFATPRSTAVEREKLADWTWQKFAWAELAPQYEAFYRSLRRQGDA